jgi:hypothetical protein
MLDVAVEKRYSRASDVAHCRDEQVEEEDWRAVSCHREEPVSMEAQ